MTKEIAKSDCIDLIKGLMAGMEEVLGQRAAAAIIHYGAVKHGKSVVKNGKYKNLAEFVKCPQCIMLASFELEEDKKSATLKFSLDEKNGAEKGIMYSLCKGLMEGGFREINDGAPEVEETEEAGIYKITFKMAE